MYEIDGICYAKNDAPPLEITAAKPLEGRMLLVTFDNDEQRLFDTLLLKGEVFEPLQDKRVFESVAIAYGTVTWQDESIDVAPEYIYEHSHPYNAHDVVRQEG